MSSSKPDPLAIYRSAVHPAVAVLPPFLLLLSLVSLTWALAGIVGVDLSWLAPLTTVWLLVCLAAAVSAAALSNLNRNERLGSADRLRQFIVGIAACFVLNIPPACLVTGTWEPAIAGAAMAGLQWLLSSSAQSALRDRELLLQAAAGKTGGGLYRAMRDDLVLTEATIGGLRKQKSSFLLQATVVGFLWLLVVSFAVRPGPFALFAPPLFSACALLCAALMQDFIDEQLLFGEGLVLSARQHALRLVHAAAILPFAAALALIFSRNASLLPPETVLGFLESLGPLDIVRLPQNRQMPWQQPPIPPPGGIMPGAARPWPFLEFLAEALKNLVLPALVIGLLVFTAWPLLNADTRGRLAGSALARFLRSRLRFLGGVLRSLALRGAPRRPNAGKAREQQTAGSFDDRPRGRKAQRSMLLRTFAAVVAAGRPFGVRADASRTAADYARELGSRAPSALPLLVQTAEAFDEAVFSGRMPSQELLSRYKKAARLAIRELQAAQRRALPDSLT